MYKGTETLNPNRILHDPAIINYLLDLDVPIYKLSYKDKWFCIAGEEITDKLNKYKG